MCWSAKCMVRGVYPTLHQQALQDTLLAACLCPTVGLPPLAEFIERMEVCYSATAAANGCLMASAAGFDSVPADMGCLFAQRAFQPPAVPSAVEAVITVAAPKGTHIHYATWWVEQQAGH